MHINKSSDCPIASLNTANCSLYSWKADVLLQFSDVNVTNITLSSVALLFYVKNDSRINVSIRYVFSLHSILNILENVKMFSFVNLVNKNLEDKVQYARQNGLLTFFMVSKERYSLAALYINEYFKILWVICRGDCCTPSTEVQVFDSDFYSVVQSLDFSGGFTVQSIHSTSKDASQVTCVLSNQILSIAISLLYTKISQNLLNLFVTLQNQDREE